MKGYVDMHCHWLAGVDDGAQTPAESLELLRGLRGCGFDLVMATPHMRDGLFDNTRAELEKAYAVQQTLFAGEPGLPERGLACEHHFDDIVFSRLLSGEGLLYPGNRAALVELPTERFPVRLQERLFELRCRRIRPVLAHPERYRPVWRDLHVLEPILDGGTVLLLDLGALSGRYGRTVRRSAEELLEAGYYYAACSDAHKVDDLGPIAQGIARLVDLAGADEASFMLSEGPRSILEGRVED